MASTLIESLRRDLITLEKAGAVGEATKKEFDPLTASGDDTRPADTGQLRQGVRSRPGEVR